MKTLVFVLLTTACLAQGAPKPSSKPSHPSPAAKPAVEQALLQADRDFAQATAQRRLEGWMEFMAEDAVLVTGAKPVVGKAAIREFHAPGFTNPDFQLNWQPTRAEMFPAGNMGYTVGRYELHAKNAKGEAVVRHGTYLTMWKKQADGSWKVIADGGAPDPAK